MNQIIVAGHLGADPEVRFTSSGKKVTTLRIATNSKRGDTEETTWWRVTVWGDQFDKMISFLKKGSPVIVFGELQKPKIFTDREGASQISLDVTAHHLQFSPFGRPNPQQQTGEAKGAQASSPYMPPGSMQMSGGPAPNVGLGSSVPNFEDEIPF